MYVGIDIGTSGIKVALVDADGGQHGSANRPVDVSRPKPSWSEQDPDLWWAATAACFDELAQTHKQQLAAVRGIGLSGQMLGPVLIDANDNPVWPCILWNDGRAVTESAALAARMPDVAAVVGYQPNPGSGAPKLMWLAAHHPEALARADCLLLPKDFVRLRLTGERYSEPTDACGTALMDTQRGSWSAALCEAAGVDMAILPPVTAAYAPAGEVLPALADRWGLPRGVPVAAGAGDNMAGTIGVGGGLPGDTVVTVGTSAVICAVDGKLTPIPESAVLTHQHAVPGTFLSMGVVLSATAVLSWAADLVGLAPGDLVAKTEAAWARGEVGADAPILLPYLSGVRTPHDRPQAQGLMAGLTLETGPADLGWAVLEGVAFQIKDAMAAQQAAGVAMDRVQFVGGGARSKLWGQMIAAATEMTLDLPAGREIGASLGAARLARVAAEGGDPVSVLAAKPAAEVSIGPADGGAALADLMAARWRRYQALVGQTLDLL